MNSGPPFGSEVQRIGPGNGNNNNNNNNQQNKGSRSKRKDEGGAGSNKKQRVFTNKSNQQQTPKASPSVRPPPLLTAIHQQQTTTTLVKFIETKDTNNAKFFGPSVHEIVMEDILFRFLYNIPSNEKENKIRVCFHIELAHWFFLDFYCMENGEIPERLRGLIPCQQVGFQQFVRQVFYKCDYLEKWRQSVDQIISEFHFYKAHVPTYGVIMLDPTLNYILLVQGYYSSKNSWGFPKGKINEDEVPLECALREAYEEVGFDASDHIKDPDKFRPLQHFFGETLVRLFLATEVPMDFQFKPHLRNEIRKISWFSIRDLPKFSKDNEGCARLGKGFTSKNFYSVLPFVKGISAFIEKERKERNKPKCTVLKAEVGSETSAFQPVIPRALSQQKLTILSPNMINQNMASSSTTIPFSSSNENEPSTSTSSIRRSTVDNLFKPLKLDPTNQPPTSFTGQSFLEHIGKATATTEGQIPSNPAGVIGGESQIRRNKEIKHPKPMPATGPVVIVYEAPPAGEQTSSPENTQRNEKEPGVTAKDEGGTAHEIVDMLKSSISKGEKQQKQQSPQQTSSKEIAENMETPKKGGKVERKVHQAQSPMTAQKPAEIVDIQQILSQFVPTQVHRCEAWKKFTLDRTRLQPR